VDILATNETFAAPMDATYSLLGLSPKDVTTLEQYLQSQRAAVARPQPLASCPSLFLPKSVQR